MSEELKPLAQCPFCGETPTLEEPDRLGPFVWHKHLDCPLSAPLKFHPEVWAKRAPCPQCAEKDRALVALRDGYHKAHQACAEKDATLERAHEDHRGLELHAIDINEERMALLAKLERVRVTIREWKQCSKAFGVETSSGYELAVRQLTQCADEIDAALAATDAGKEHQKGESDE